MNKDRRRRIARAIALMDQAREILEDVSREELEAFDNMPENLQCSERGEQMEEYIDTIDEAIDNLDTMYLQEIVEG